MRHLFYLTVRVEVKTELSLMDSLREFEQGAKVNLQSTPNGGERSRNFKINITQF
ncbi:hypothetical protein [Pedobacter sp. GR22-6]|uniref:hypothetical protein n=1 Tax=Pedobacter sp. GR22-6 TaxID=3127957 RepID=UPI00307E0E62